MFSTRGSTTESLADFVAQTRYWDLPPDVVHETKRLLLDIIGCALGSVGIDKGKIALRYASAAAGQPEATILGTGQRACAATAAFANGELMHTLDYCALLPPSHITAFVTPAPLALAEARAASGKTLLLAVALAHEVASRVGLSLDPMRMKKGGLVAQSWGLGFDQFGATAGAAKVLGLDSVAMADALGLAGYFAPVPSHNKFLNTPEGGGMAKYGPAGWTAQGGVTTAMLAGMGYDGDRTVLDGDFGFWAMTGSKGCDLSKITTGLGEQWNILRTMYKRWPCAGLFQSPMGAFTRLVDEHDLRPGEIERVLIRNEEQGQLPGFLYRQIRHNVDTQNNLAYNISMAAHRVDVSAAWQSARYLSDPAILAFMAKVVVEPYARAEETRHLELVVERRPYIERRPCHVEVSARGRVFEFTVEYAQWLSIDNPEFRATDEELVAKFRANARATLPPAKLDRAVEKIMNLDTIDTTSALMEDLVP